MTDELLRQRIRRAVDARLSSVADDPFLAQRIAANAKGALPMKKKFAAFPVLVAVLIFLTAAIAVAVDVIDLHVLDWLYPAWDNPYEAAFPQTTGDISHPIADVRIHEAVSDGYGVYISVVCTPKKENTLLLNASVSPRDDASMIGLTSDYPRQTIGAWADKHGYSIYDVRLYTIPSYADMSNNTGFDSASGMTQRTEDGSTIIMMGGGTVPLPEEYRLNYIITPYQKQTNGLWQVDEWAASDQQRTIAFSIDVPEAPEAEVLAEYAVSPDTPTQYIDLTGCRFFRTPLATYAEFTYTFRDETIAQQNRPANDHFFIVQPDVFNWTVKADIRGRETLPDGTTLLRHIMTVNHPLDIPETMLVQASPFIPDAADNPQELITLERISK